MTAPHRSITCALPLIRRPEIQSWMQGWTTRIERRRLNLVFRRRLSEVRIFPLVYKELYRATASCRAAEGMGCF